MVKIFIGNIKEGSKSEDLKSLFEKHGKVTECDILTNFGFVHMEKEEDAVKAVKALHETTFNGSIIRVEMSHGKKSEKGPYRGGYAARGGGGGYRGAYRGAYAPYTAEVYDPGYGYAEPEYATEEVYDGYGGELYYTGAAAGADLYADPYGAGRAYDAYGRRRPPVRVDPYASSLVERRAAMARPDPYRAVAVDPYYGGPAVPRPADPYASRVAAAAAADPYYGGSRIDPYARATAADLGDGYARAAEQPRMPVDLIEQALPRSAVAAADPFAVPPVERDPFARAALDRSDPYAASASARATASMYDVSDRAAAAAAAAAAAQPAAVTSRVLDRPPPEYYRRAAALGGAAGYDTLMERSAAFTAPERSRPY